MRFELVQKEERMKNSNTCPLYQRVIECALSNSIDYRSIPHQLSNVDFDRLKDCFVQYIRKKEDCSEEEGKKYFDACLQRALSKRRPDGNYSIWVIIGAFVSLAAGIINLVAVVETRFNLVFLLFFLLCASLCKTEVKTLLETKKVHQAAQVWIKAIKRSSAQELLGAVDEMESILA